MDQACKATESQQVPRSIRRGMQNVPKHSRFDYLDRVNAEVFGCREHWQT